MKYIDITNTTRCCSRLLILLSWLFLVSLCFGQSWERTYGVPWLNESARSVKQTMDGGYIIAATKGGGGPDFAMKSLWLIRIDEYGDTLWTRTYGKDSCAIYGDDVLETSTGCFIVLSYNYDNVDSLNRHIILIKVSSSGDTIWTKTFGRHGEGGMRIIPAQDGGYAIVGTYSHWVVGDSVEDIYLARVNSDGDTMWTKRIDRGEMEVGYDIVQDRDSGFVIIGSTGTSASFSDMKIYISYEN